MLLLWGMDLVIYWVAPLACASFCPQLMSIRWVDHGWQPWSTPLSPGLGETVQGQM